MCVCLFFARFLHRGAFFRKKAHLEYTLKTMLPKKEALLPPSIDLDNPCRCVQISNRYALGSHHGPSYGQGKGHPGPSRGEGAKKTHEHQKMFGTHIGRHDAQYGNFLLSVARPGS